MSHRIAIVTYVVMLLTCGGAVTLLTAQTSDGAHHGDPPFVLEDGWRSFLSGRDLSGWHCHPTHGNASDTNTWRAVRGVRWDPLDDPTVLEGTETPGDRIINGGKTCNLITDERFGDIELYLEFMVAERSNSGVYLHGLYEVQILDSFGKAEVGTGDGGAIYHRWIDEKPVDGSPPKVNANRRPGRWQSFHIWFRAPRFDEAGKKTENARFVRVLHNGLLVQKDVDLRGPTRAHLPIPEASRNPIMLQGDHGPVAFRNIYIRPLRSIQH